MKPSAGHTRARIYVRCGEADVWGEYGGKRKTTTREAVLTRSHSISFAE